MNLALSGQIVEPGIAIGQAHNIQRNEIEIGEYRIGEEQIDSEIERLLRGERLAVDPATLTRPDIDAIAIATPPHWHCLQAVAAAEKGKLRGSVK